MPLSTTAQRLGASRLDSFVWKLTATNHSIHRTREYHRNDQSKLTSSSPCRATTFYRGTYGDATSVFNPGQMPVLAGLSSTFPSDSLRRDTQPQSSFTSRPRSDRLQQSFHDVTQRHRNAIFPPLRRNARYFHNAGILHYSDATVGAAQENSSARLGSLLHEKNWHDALQELNKRPPDAWEDQELVLDQLNQDDLEDDNVQKLLMIIKEDYDMAENILGAPPTTLLNKLTSLLANLYRVLAIQQRKTKQRIRLLKQAEEKAKARKKNVIYLEEGIAPAIIQRKQLKATLETLLSESASRQETLDALSTTFPATPELAREALREETCEDIMAGLAENGKDKDIELMGRYMRQSDADQSLWYAYALRAGSFGSMSDSVSSILERFEERAKTNPEKFSESSRQKLLTEALERYSREGRLEEARRVHAKLELPQEAKRTLVSPLEAYIRLEIENGSTEDQSPPWLKTFEMFFAAKDIDPKSLDVAGRTLHLLLDKGRFSDAYKVASKLLEKGTVPHPWYLARLGELALEAGLTEEAHEALSIILLHNTMDSETAELLLGEPELVALFDDVAATMIEDDRAGVARDCAQNLLTLLRRLKVRREVSSGFKPSLFKIAEACQGSLDSIYVLWKDYRLINPDTELGLPLLRAYKDARSSDDTRGANLFQSEDFQVLIHSALKLEALSLEEKAEIIALLKRDMVTRGVSPSMSLDENIEAVFQKGGRPDLFRQIQRDAEPTSVSYNAPAPDNAFQTIFGDFFATSRLMEQEDVSAKRALEAEGPSPMEASVPYGVISRPRGKYDRNTRLDLENMLESSIRKGHLSTAKAVFEEYIGRGQIPKLRLLAMLLTVLGRQRMLDDAIHIFHSTKRHVLKKGETIGSLKQCYILYCLVIRACAVAHDIGKAMEFYEKMKDEVNQAPDQRTFLVLLHQSNFVRDQVDPFPRVYQDIENSTEPLDTKMYNIMMTQRLYREDYKTMDELFDRMQEENIPRTSVSYSIRVSALLRRDRLDEALQIFDAMLRKLERFESPAAMNNIIQHLIRKRGDVERAMSFYKEVTNSRPSMVPSNLTYRLLFEGLCSQPSYNVDQAMNLLNDLSSRQGIETAKIPFTIILHGCGIMQRSTEMAKSVFWNVMARRYKVQPNPACMHKMVEIGLFNNDFEDAEKIIQMVRSLIFRPVTTNDFTASRIASIAQVMYYNALKFLLNWTPDSNKRIQNAEGEVLELPEPARAMPDILGRPAVELKRKLIRWMSDIARLTSDPSPASPTASNETVDDADEARDVSEAEEAEQEEGADYGPNPLHVYQQSVFRPTGYMARKIMLKDRSQWTDLVQKIQDDQFPLEFPSPDSQESINGRRMLWDAIDGLLVKGASRSTQPQASP